MRTSKTSLLLAAMVTLTAFNLRTIAVAIGPVLPSIQEELGMSQTVAGLLTSLPTLCFALFGFMASSIGEKLGLHRAILAAITINVIGQVLRLNAQSTTGFMVASCVALAGIGVINVLLPPLVKRHFPLRNGLVTSFYTTSQSIGLTVASLYTAPLAIAFGSWRGAYWVWAGTAAVAAPLIIWAVVRFRDTGATKKSRVSIWAVGRTRLGWMMAIFFAMQSAQAYGQFGWLPTIYQAAGFDAVEAGNFLAIVAGVGIPFSFIIPNLTVRMKKPTWLIIGMAAFGVVGYGGLLWNPQVLPWLWPIFLAVAGAFFPMILVLIGAHTKTPEATAPLSSFSQSVGYVIACLGPFLMGALKDATGSFIAPIWVQLLMFAPLAVCGVIASRSGMLEDELPA
ncbi:MFS transporter [Propionimicrobium sp. PCR01-08-3]|uniref:MFS transporter n=1 Tax=Propionimicrobium sp. PCR01-08-3 TaxID=3052086 RepID=UPI00255CE0D1|nr:MFS transporter [Propionimicrobium sp. PCR01-08-3]WIY83516.1 MFS transporter [Propionimicrobium sp. PCR01-08-3]